VVAGQLTWHARQCEDTERSARLGRLAGFKGALCVEPEQVMALTVVSLRRTARDAEWAEACKARDDARRDSIEWAANV